MEFSGANRRSRLLRYLVEQALEDRPEGLKESVIATEVFDHTSQLLFLQTLFGATVPNITSWRSSTVGDLTSSLPVLPGSSAGSPDYKVPVLPVVSDDESSPPISSECNSSQILELNPSTTPYPVPKHQRQPKQEHGKFKPTPT